MVDDPSKVWAALIKRTAKSAKRRSLAIKEQINTLDKQLAIMAELVQELLEVGEIHKPDAFAHCREDQQPWPCDTASPLMKTYERIVQEWE